MKHSSRRAKRMERHHKRTRQPALNLVSLMDIFTILVFFLLVSSSSVQQLPKKKDIRLPESIASKAPRETLIIFVTQTTLLVQGRAVAQVDTVLQRDAPMINELVDELNFHASKTPLVKSAAGEKPKKGRSVTIMGDEKIPYALLRKILASCREADYTNIAFAAMQKAAGSEGV